MQRTSPRFDRVLGIDTALRCTGYGVIDSDGQSFHAVDCGVIKTSPKEPLSQCLGRIAGGVRELIETYKPSVAAIEGGFFFRNPKTAMVLGSARGAAIVALAEASLLVYEYSPRRVKQAVCGHGNASKEQVGLLVAQLLSLSPGELPHDATDGLAIAVCHIQTAHSMQGIHLPDPL